VSPNKHEKQAKAAPPDPRGTDKIRLTAQMALLVICLAGGGSSRADVYSLLYLRPIAALVLAAVLLVTTGREVRAARVPLILLGLLAASMVIQLIPLPPEIWSVLPGRPALAEAAAAAGIASVWRPISLTPDLTLNSLISLVPPLAALLATVGLTGKEHRFLILVLIGAAVASSVLGIAQLVAGAADGPYLYTVPTRGTASGLFANRNHNAAFLAIGLLCLGHWVSLHPSQRRGRLQPLVRMAAAAAIGVLFLLMIIATGSRTGSVIALPVLVATILQALPKGALRSRRGRAAAIIVPVMVVCGAIALAIAAGRGASFDRFIGFDADAENRLENLPVLLEMLRTFWLVGIGYGAFDPAFRWFEPDHLLHPQYFNHAHSDWLELVLTGGVPAALVLAAFVAWVVVTALRILRNRDDRNGYGGLGIGIVLILGAASVSDYPLRTPLLAVLLAIGCGWATLRPAAAPEHGRTDNRHWLR